MIRRSAQRQPDRVCVIERDRSTTFREMDVAANRIANYLRAAGIAQGSKVATLCGNSTDYLQFIFGVHKAGLVWVPVNIVLGLEEIGYIIEHAEARLMLIDEVLFDRLGFDAFVRNSGISYLVIESSTASSRPRLGEVIRDQPSTELPLAVEPDELAMIMYTSGTTSRAKGVMHCHHAVISAVFSNVGELSITRDDRVLVFLPMFHIAAHCLCMTFLAAGASVVLQKGFDAGASLEAIEKHKVTFLVGLPMMFQAMLDHPRRRSTDLSSLRVCNYAMAPMAKTVLERLIAEFCPTFLLTSGQTEAYPHTVIFRPEEQLRRFGNYWGQGVLGNDVAIMDDLGNLLPAGQIGEIVYRGPNMMLGYYKDPEATLEASRFGWHHSGDLGAFDQDGQLRFVDRKKDIIKSGGENVASVKVEEVILRHPAVAAVAVVGIPHPRWQEAILACVQLRPDSEVTAHDIITHCKAHLGGFEVPKAVEFVDDMPLTASAKLRKIDLRERFLEFFMSEAAG
ncbi:class I adenylate-forming enzyme family protein [Sphingobium sp.]|uniref:class I adenylate-forming enzyme family protein n=1 Tax=Sphingobium sp. TaxID=1912891 RepID=UPI0028BDAF72|nr:AMP-binding protein [Sphingobium sp.]